MAKYSMMKCDKAKLYAALRARNVTPSDAAREFGYGRHYLMNCASKGEMTETCAVLLDRVYGIKREEYEVKNEPLEIAQPEIKGGEINYDRLYRVVYGAMYSAYKQVLCDRRDGKF